jgi:hypothetical protein
MKKALNFISSPEGYYPKVEINKVPIETTLSEIVLQRIESYLRTHTDDFKNILKERIEAFLIENKFSYETSGNVNSPLKEVW